MRGYAEGERNMVSPAESLKAGSTKSMPRHRVRWFRNVVEMKSTIAPRARQSGHSKEYWNAKQMATDLSAGGGALPVILSIIGPRETHDYRN